MSTEPLLTVQGLGKSFGGVKAVDGIDFTLAPGELLALIGPNGAGKSTTFNIINGQLAADRGSVRLAGRGAWMQVTAGALTGRFGTRPRYWAARLVGEGHPLLLAADAHDPRRRPPVPAEGQKAAARPPGADPARQRPGQPHL